MMTVKIKPINLNPILKTTFSNQKPITKAIKKPIIIAPLNRSFPPYGRH